MLRFAGLVLCPRARSTDSSSRAVSNGGRMTRSARGSTEKGRTNGDLSDLHVVVTGGTGALGTAVSQHLLNAGAQVHIPCFSAQELEGLPFVDHPAVHIEHPVDLTDAQVVERYYASLPPLWASLQVAGGFAMAPIVETEPAEFSRLMELNVTSCFLCCRAAVASMRRRGGEEPTGGRLVNVAARPALENRLGAGMVAYTISKAAVAALSVSLGEELAGEGIWVNAVAPSIIDTPANRQAMPEADHNSWAAVADIAETMAFLASPLNRTTRSGILPVYGRS